MIVVVKKGVRNVPLEYCESRTVLQYIKDAGFPSPVDTGCGVLLCGACLTREDLDKTIIQASYGCKSNRYDIVLDERFGGLM